jgi:hypothetical protein
VNVATDNQPTPLTFGRVVRRLPLYFGLAFASLLAFSIVFAIGVHFGMVGKFRFIWVGFAAYTGLLFWVVVRQAKPHWYRPNFWFVIFGLLAIHCFVFVSVLRVYPEWRPIWFWPTTVIEAGAIGGFLEWLFPEKHIRHHRTEKLHNAQTH